jgi:hypothetical protein
MSDSLDLRELTATMVLDSIKGAATELGRAMALLPELGLDPDTEEAVADTLAKAAVHALSAKAKIELDPSLKGLL